MAKEIDIGAYSAYAIAVKHGYQGTEAEFAAQLKDSAANGALAQDGAERAEAAAEEAAETLANIPEDYAVLSEMAVENTEKIGRLSEEIERYQAYTFTNYGQENILKYCKWINGYYIQPSNGEPDVNASYSASDYIVLDNTKRYLCEVKDATWYYAFYDAEKNYISGDAIAANYYWNLTNNVMYCRVSMQTAAIGDNSAHIEGVEQELNKNIKVAMSAIYDDTATRITVSKDGSKQFTSLRQALESIADSSETHKYIVEYYGDGTHYNVAADYSEEERQNLIGLTIPDYTTLVGIGGREKCILSCFLASEESNRIFSTLNMKTTSGLKGFTVAGDRTRNVLHQDFGNVVDGTSFVEDCTFIGSNLYLHYVCACGVMSGCKLIYKNCKFVNETATYTYSCHNGESLVNPGRVEFVNCRFIPFGEGDFSVRLGSLSNTASNYCECIIKGCKIPLQLLLNEEAPETYGKGIVWYVSGYGNDIESIGISATDNVDYSSHVDVIYNAK